MRKCVFVWFFEGKNLNTFDIFMREQNDYERELNKIHLIEKLFHFKFQWSPTWNRIVIISKTELIDFVGNFFWSMQVDKREEEKGSITTLKPKRARQMKNENAHKGTQNTYLYTDYHIVGGMNVTSK